MHLTKKTTFEWNGNQELTDLRVDSYQPQNGAPALMVTVSVWANHEIHMRRRAASQLDTGIDETVVTF